eukprot:scaffold9427_cov100-Isochrysis_galbana.AAC.2
MVLFSDPSSIPLWGQQASLAGQPYGYSHIGPGPGPRGRSFSCCWGAGGGGQCACALGRRALLRSTASPLPVAIHVEPQRDEMPTCWPSRVGNEPYVRGGRRHRDTGFAL